jgi:MEMO1 family protein
VTAHEREVRQPPYDDFDVRVTARRHDPNPVNSHDRTSPSSLSALSEPGYETCRADRKTLRGLHRTDYSDPVMTGPKDHGPRSSDDPAARGEARPPAFAGLFYPDDARRCAQMAGAFVRAGDAASSDDASDATPLGGIVPHAGWVCSGAVAGLTIGALARQRQAQGIGAPRVVVLFGAIHTPLPIEDVAALDSYASWSLPGAASAVAPELRTKLCRESRRPELFRTDDRFHRREHAIEVELPLVRAAWPGAAILPVEVPLCDAAVEVGVETARRVASMGLTGRDVVFLASSDLTHYGPAYRFVPAGVGFSGLAWARDNDRRLLERIERFEVEQVVGHVRDTYSACGGGAIAATLAACRELGARGARTLRQTNSYEVLSAAGHRDSPDDAVGYASVVIG